MEIDIKRLRAAVLAAGSYQVAKATGLSPRACYTFTEPDSNPTWRVVVAIATHFQQSTKGKAK